MDWMRAIGVALAVYVVSFLVMMGGVRMASADTTWFLTIGSAWLAMAIGSYWYFRSSKTRPTVTHGALLGVTEIVVGVVLDLLVMMPMLMPGIQRSTALMEFYTRPTFVIAAVFMIGIPAVMGLLMSKGR